ncbi:hypothetical protein E2C01_012256 [Portunus trituberculatus]|uniref:Uncharacterized protein n=1 Tax=Portunus trituberculatus TaxID=210409 RepID=A0A5B7DDJ4_PORTR|nr:hypothetical protein [Portunus trituberculatus]
MVSSTERRAYLPHATVRFGGEGGEREGGRVGSLVLVLRAALSWFAVTKGSCEAAASQAWEVEGVEGGQRGAHTPSISPLNFPSSPPLPPLYPGRLASRVTGSRRCHLCQSTHAPALAGATPSRQGGGRGVDHEVEVTLLRVMGVRGHDMLLEAVLAVEPFLADGALEAVGRRVQPLVPPAGARLREPLATVPTGVGELVPRGSQHILAITRRLQPPHSRHHHHHHHHHHSLSLHRLSSCTRAPPRELLPLLLLLQLPPFKHVQLIPLHLLFSQLHLSSTRLLN